MKNNKGILAFSIGVITGSVFGFFLSGVSGAFSEIISNRYFSYKAFRLIALAFKLPFLKWFLYTLSISALLFIFLYNSRRSRLIKMLLNPGRDFKKSRLIFISALIILIFLLLANTAFISIAGSVSRDGPNIIIVVIDALREDTLGMSGYDRNTSPEIDKFAQIR